MAIDVEGWLSDAQAKRLQAAARQVEPGGTIVEIGSFRGKSAIVFGTTARDGVAIVAIDPHGGGDRGPNEIRADQARGDADNAAFHANLERAGVSGRIRHVRKPSAEALHDVPATIDLLYVDGAHRFSPARDDIARYGSRVGVGGTLLIHDSFNAIGVTLAILRLLVTSSDFRYVGRTASLAEYRREPVNGPGRIGNAIRQLAQLGYFARMLAVKVALTARTYPLSRALGHDSRDWPY